jgi:hypothetical protein
MACDNSRSENETEETDVPPFCFCHVSGGQGQALSCPQRQIALGERADLHAVTDAAVAEHARRDSGQTFISVDVGPRRDGSPFHPQTQPTGGTAAPPMEV